MQFLNLKKNIEQHENIIIELTNKINLLENNIYIDFYKKFTTSICINISNESYKKINNRNDIIYSLISNDDRNKPKITLIDKNKYTIKYKNIHDNN